jgi:endonuclease IV
MPSILDQLRDLDAKRQQLLEKAVEQLQSEVQALNDLGYSYVLVRSDATPRRTKRSKAASADIRWSTSITRISNYAKANKLTKAQALDSVRLALDRLAAKKGVSVPDDVLAQAEQAVAEAYKK